MDMKLELVPVTDIDRAKLFCSQQTGFTLDHDVQPSPTVRVVQLTPPGSACSIVLGEGLSAWPYRLARCAACTWWWPTLARPAPNWPAVERPWATFKTWAAA